jgi:hypothetical protein
MNQKSIVAAISRELARPVQERDSHAGFHRQYNPISSEWSATHIDYLHKNHKDAVNKQAGWYWRNPDDWSLYQVHGPFDSSIGAYFDATGVEVDR